jgi:hypothetical protein
MADFYPKVVLALIRVCLLVLLGWGPEALPSDEPAGLEMATGRYEFVVFSFRRGRTILIRHDTATGEVWGLRRWAGEDVFWIDMTEVRLPETDAEEEVVPEAAAAPASTPEGEAAPAEGEAAPPSESSQGAPGDETPRGSEE